MRDTPPAPGRVGADAGPVNVRLVGGGTLDVRWWSETIMCCRALAGLLGSSEATPASDAALLLHWTYGLLRHGEPDEDMLRAALAATARATSIPYCTWGDMRRGTAQPIDWARELLARDLRSRTADLGRSEVTARQPSLPGLVYATSAPERAAYRRWGRP